MAEPAQKVCETISQPAQDMHTQFLPLHWIQCVGLDFPLRCYCFVQNNFAPKWKQALQVWQ